MIYRKCCETPKGSGPHEARCVNAEGGTKRNPFRGMSKADRLQLAFDMGDDLPDGAFFALADELGVSIDDIAELGDAQ